MGGNKYNSIERRTAWKIYDLKRIQNRTRNYETYHDLGARISFLIHKLGGKYGTE